MTLPTFLGIGVPRAGTTWLHELLASHPDVYVPTRRKEIFFFDMYYERGLSWYERFFPSEAQAGRFQAIGEITPTYIYRPYCPERIAKVPSITKLIVTLRSPVTRAYSQYGKLEKSGQYSGSFEDFLSDRPNVIATGFYGRYLENYYEYFRRDQILVLIYEHATADLSGTKVTLARFLGVVPERFPADAGVNIVNRSYIPKHRSAYALSSKVAWNLLRYKWDLDWAVNLAKRLGIERLLGEAGPLPPMKRETQQYLQQMYADEVEKLESLLSVQLACWK